MIDGRETANHYSECPKCGKPESMHSLCVKKDPPCPIRKAREDLNAAAPNLLAALDRLVDRMMIDVQMDGPRYKGFNRNSVAGRTVDDDRKDAIAALAKAKGEG